MVDSPEAATEGRKGALRKKLIVALLLVAVVGGAAYWFLLRPTPVLAPEPGEVVALEPIQVNLADGPYLRVAIALQATLDVEEEVDGSRAPRGEGRRRHPDRAERRPDGSAGRSRHRARDPPGRGRPRPRVSRSDLVTFPNAQPGPVRRHS